MMKKIICIFVCMLLSSISFSSVATSIYDEKVNNDKVKPIQQIIENGIVPNENWIEIDKLLASDGDEEDRFGYSVSISGDYAIIGAKFDDDLGDETGSVYIFHNDGTNWEESIKLLPSDANHGDLFGNSVDICGDYAIVGSHWDDDNGWNSGSAYIFKRDGSTWIEHAKLLPSDGGEQDCFGRSVSINGEYVIVGAHYDYNSGIRSGSAYIFKLDGSSWYEQAKLIPSDLNEHSIFGCSSSICGDYAIVGAPHHDGNGLFAGAAYIFKRDGTTWYEQNRLHPSDGDAWDRFGLSVDISDDNVIIGAHTENDEVYDGSGAAYIFKRNGTTWQEQEKIVPSDTNINDEFGWSSSICGDHAIVGSHYDFPQGPYSGSAYIFKFDGENWIEQDKIYASDGDIHDFFGMSVSIDDDFSIVGSSYDDDNGYDSGSAYIFNKINTIFEISGGLGVNLIVTNILDEDISDISLEIHVIGGILGLINKTVSETLDIPAGESVTVGTGLFFGLGSFEIEASVEGNVKTATGTQLIFLSIIN